MPFIRQLNPETLRLLERIYRQSRHHQVRQRAHCLILTTQGLTFAQLMQIFGITRKTLYNWFNTWEQRGVAGLYNRPGRGRKPTFTPEQQDQIRAWAQQYPQQLKRILHKVKTEWNITVSQDTVKRVLKALRLSWHRFRRLVGGQPHPQEYETKRHQLEELKRLDEQGEIELLYLDETGFCLIPYIPYGWQPIGETIGIPSVRSRRLNVLGLLNRRHTLSAYVFEQSITDDVVIAGIEHFCQATHKRTVIVLDQSSIHTSDAIYDKLEEWRQRHIELFWLLSYSPQLNLIEIVWRFMKYEWIELSAYESWQSLVEYVEKVLREFGDNYIINFA